MELKQMELKEKLVDLRKEKGLSQAELAEAINVSRQAISRWEVGSAIPSADNLMWLSKFYEVSMDELMDISCDDGQEKSQEKPSVKSKAGVSPKILIFLCMLAVIIVVAVWAVFYMFLYMFQGTENKKIDLRELESKEYSSSELIDMDIKFVNP